MEKQNGICKEKCTSFPNCNPCGELQEKDLWEKSFEVLLSNGDVYSYDYNAAIVELKRQGFSISQVIDRKCDANYDYDALKSNS